MEINWNNIDEKLPELNTRCLCIEVWKGNKGQPDQYHAEFARYVIISKTFGDSKGEPCFVDEQDEQPGRCGPQYWISEEELLKSLTPISNK